MNSSWVSRILDHTHRQESVNLFFCTLYLYPCSQPASQPSRVFKSSGALWQILRSFAHLLLQHLFKKKISSQVILTGANIVDDQNPKNKKRLDYVRFHTYYSSSSQLVEIVWFLGLAVRDLERDELICCWINVEHIILPLDLILRFNLLLTTRTPQLL
jgi:hypothetical protein